jgi:hypothetical protein
VLEGGDIMNKYFASAFALAAVPACCMAQQLPGDTGLLATLAHDVSIEYVRQAGPGLWLGTGTAREGAALSLGAPLPPRLSEPPLRLARSIEALEQAERFVAPYKSFMTRSYTIGLQRGEGAWSLTARRVTLGPTFSERDLELTYSRPLDRDARLSGALMVRRHSWQDMGSTRDVLIGIRYTRRF